MSNPITNLLARAVAWVLVSLKSNPQFRRVYTTMLGDTDNQDTFTSLGLHEKMLADDVRLDHYHQAIEAHVKEGDTVLDVGTGSGVLAFFAAKQKARKVYAIDHSEIIEVAKRVATHNRLSNVEFLRQNSREFAPAEKLDVIVQEQIGWCLFEEGMVSTLVDLRDRLLKKGGKIIPNRFELYVEPVQLKDKYRVPFIWEQRVHGIDYGCLNDLARTESSRGHLRRLETDEVDFLLSDPAKMYACDLETMKETDLPDRFQGQRVVARDGRLDGFCLYFGVIFDERIAFRTFPTDPRTHWGVPLFRTESRPCRKGDVLDYNLTIGDVRDPNSWTLTSSRR